MSQSVKLSDGSYIDTDAVWDNVNTLSLTTSIKNLYASAGKYAVHQDFAGINGGRWDNSFTNGFECFYYEGQDTTTYNLPTSTCVVLVFKLTNGRGAAMAIEWRGLTAGSITRMWLNHLHCDTDSPVWAGWTKVTTATTTI